MRPAERYVATEEVHKAVKGREPAILKQLGVNWTGSVAHIHCPFPDHEDKNPSWRWDETKAKAFCTCGTQDILGVLMKMEKIDFNSAKVRIAELIKRSDLIRQKKAKRTVVATFDYTDEAGDVLFQVVRYEPKAFSQRRPDGEGGWIEGKGAMQGVRIVPYRLPELIAAVARGETIYIPEGEKHVDRLFSIGIAATCNPMGAKKWRSEFAQYFLGPDVVVLPDNDKPGHEHAQKVAANLSSVAKCIRVVALPVPKVGGDVIDWLDAGGTSTELADLANATSPWKAHSTSKSAARRIDPEPKDTESGERVKQADAIIELALERIEVFHAPDGTAFADVRVNDHRETLRIASSGFRLWVTGLFYDVHKTAPNSDAMKNALNVLEAKARYKGTEREVSVRVAGAHGKSFIDLGTLDWAAVEIDAKEWREVSSPSVRFRRARGCLALPMPVRGGSVDALRRFLNLKSNEDFALVVAWLLAALRHHGPYPVLVLTGEQGSAKSTLARVLKRLVDPNTAPLRKLADSVRDLFIAANNSHVIAYENVSTLPVWLSDALCILATGGGYATRENYSDAEETIFDAQRPIILNGIEDFVTRGDLADRSVTLMLPRIDENTRRDEETFWLEFNSAAPAILGALLDAVAYGLKALPEVKLDKTPRMADFAKWAVACEGALSWSKGTFLAAYSANRLEVVDAILEVDPVALAVRALLLKKAEWNGTAADLLKALNAASTEEARRQKTWPKSPRGMSGVLRRVAPDLLKLGYKVDLDERDKNKDRRRLIHLAAPVSSGKGPSEPSELSKPLSQCDLLADGTPDNERSVKQLSVEPSVQNPLGEGRLDGVDGLDDRASPSTDADLMDDLKPGRKVSF